MPSASADRLIEVYAHVGAINRSLLGRLERLLACFHERGIDCIVLKGADVVPRLYGVWGLRPMLDIDLLVRPSDLPAIDAIAERLGYRPTIDENPSYIDSDRTTWLDIAEDIWYLDDLEGIWQRAATRMQGGVPVKGMGASDLLVFLTAYAVVFRAELSASFARDVALLVEREAVDWDFVVEEAARRGLTVPIYHGLAYAVRKVGAAIPAQTLARLAPSGRRERALWYALRRLCTERRVDGMGHVLLFLTQRGRRRWRWLAHVLFPSPAFMGYRYGRPRSVRAALIRVLRPLLLVARALKMSIEILPGLIRRAGPS
jgi:hypothetical protein